MSADIPPTESEPSAVSRISQAAVNQGAILARQYVTNQIKTRAVEATIGATGVGAAAVAAYEAASFLKKHWKIIAAALIIFFLFIYLAIVKFVNAGPTEQIGEALSHSRGVQDLTLNDVTGGVAGVCDDLGAGNTANQAGADIAKNNQDQQTVMFACLLSKNAAMQISGK